MSLGKLGEKIAASWRTVFSFRVLAIFACAIVFAVLAGPFGTLTNMGLVERIALWVPLIAISIPLGWFCTLVAQSVLEHRHTFFVELVAVSMMTVIYAPCVWFHTLWIDPDAIKLTGGPLNMTLYVFVVVATVAVIRHAVLAWQVEAEPVVNDSKEEPRLLQRLPISLRAPILRLSAKDHMVEVVTEAGVANLRLRLGDAVADMEPVEGFMSHRSHWVAKSAVIEAQRRGADKIYLKLSNGDLVPVSRTFRPDWIKVGLLEASTEKAKPDAASGLPGAQAPSGSQSSPRA